MRRKQPEPAGCWVLADPALRAWWVGDGMRSVTSPAPPQTWATKEEAARDAVEINELLDAMGMKNVSPTPVRVRS